MATTTDSRCAQEHLSPLQQPSTSSASPSRCPSRTGAPPAAQLHVGQSHELHMLRPKRDAGMAQQPRTRRSQPLRQQPPLQRLQQAAQRQRAGPSWCQVRQLVHAHHMHDAWVQSGREPWPTRPWVSASPHEQLRAAVCATGVSISNGYQLLANKQGVNDQRFMGQEVCRSAALPGEVSSALFSSTASAAAAVQGHGQPQALAAAS